MKVNLIFLNGPSYQTRQRNVKYSSWAQYKMSKWAGSDQSIYKVNDVNNFNWGDGVDTSQIINKSFEASVAPATYVLVVDADDDDTILADFFVTDNEYLRNGQCKVTLRRDVLCDFWNTVNNSTLFVERGMSRNDGSYIFNNEGFQFSQVKQSQTLLQDSTNTPWIVGFLPSDAVTSDVTIYGNKMDKSISLEVTNYNDLPFRNYSSLSSNVFITGASGKAFQLYIRDRASRDPQTTTSRGFIVTADKYKVGVVEDTSAILYNSTLYYNNGNTPPTVQQARESSVCFRQAIADNENSDSYLNTAIGVQSSADVKRFLSMKDTIVHVTSTDKYYKFSCTPYSAGHETKTVTNASVISWFNTTLLPSIIAKQNEEDVLQYNGGVSSNGCFKVSCLANGYHADYVQLTPNEVLQVTLKSTNNLLSDAPYKCFYMPYYDCTINGISFKGEVSRRMATLIAEHFSGGSDLFDLQLIPYCPQIPVLEASEVDKAYTPIKLAQLQTTTSYMFWASQSTFSGMISFTQNVGNPKIDSNTKFLRFNSPDFSSSFDLNYAKNDGVKHIFYQCTIKPFNSTLQIYPNYSGLYGKNFDDQRGLVCKGTFSYPQMSNAWETYQRQNANYQNIFNRQIENMEFSNDISRQQDKINKWSGAVSSLVQGAATGALTGGGLVGAGVGGIASGIAGYTMGSLDADLNESIRQEQLSYTKDIYNMNMGNIQAMPSSLVSSGSIDCINTIFPTVELYSATDEEIAAFTRFIIMNGMSIGKIDRISNYLNRGWSYVDTLDDGKQIIYSGNFFKGTIVRAGGQGGAGLITGYLDTHEITAINQELSKGVYL